LVSPNMTYPNLVRATNEPLVASAAAKSAALSSELALVTDPTARLPLEAALKASETLRTVAQTKLDQVQGQSTSLMGLSAPLISLKNPGIISIPLGFLFVVLGSLMVRERRSEELWEEFYVRQNTGLHAEGANEH